MTRLHPWRPLAASALVLWLAACGGGDGDSSAPPAPAAVTLSGVAAAGLPLTGTITLKDATGATRTTAIGTNGSYSFDIRGLTAPVMLRADGSAGGQHYTLHSATASTTSSGTLNITPLTDLIIANVAGQVAERYFNSGNFAGLTQAEITSESNALKAKLLPVLQAMQVDAAVDLMRTPFTPLASALDQALDVIRVNVDPVANRATLTNIVNQLAIADELAVRATAEGAVAPLAATGMGSAATDVPAVRQALVDFFALFRTGLPAAGVISASLAPDFLQNGVLRDDMATGLASASDLVGLSVRNIDIQSIDYGATGGPVATVKLEFVSAAGQGDGFEEGWQLGRGQDGIWRWRGNQALVEYFGGAHAVRSHNGCLASGYEFNLYDNGHPSAASLTEMRVNGPGLPAEGMRYRRSTGGQQWEYYNGVNNPFYYRLTAAGCGGNLGAGVPDATIAAIPDNAIYTLSGFNAQGAAVPLAIGRTTLTLTVPRRTFTLAEAQAATFPTIVTSTPLASYNGGTLTITGTGASPDRSVWVYLSGMSNAGGLSAERDVATTASGSFSATLSLTAGTYSYREVRVATRDTYNRTLLSSVTAP